MSTQTPNTSKATWYNDLVSTINSFAEELGLDEFSAKKLHTFIVEKTKEHFKRGNKNGAGWAFAQARASGWHGKLLPNSTS